MKIIDLTHTINADMPIFPGTKPPGLQEIKNMAADGYQSTELKMNSHQGTHIDAPGHMVAGGKMLEQFPIDQFFGLALVIDFHGCAGKRIEVSYLQPLEREIANADFVIFHTRQAEKWGLPEYFTDYPALTPEAAEWLMQFPLKGVGFDTISADPAGAGYKIHHILLGKNDRLVIENLTNLAEIENSYCMLSVLPLKYDKADGSPVRAVAIEIELAKPPAI